MILHFTQMEATISSSHEGCFDVRVWKLGAPSIFSVCIMDIRRDAIDTSKRCYHSPAFAHFAVSVTRIEGLASRLSLI